MRRTLASRVITGLFIIFVGILVLGQVAGLWNVGNLARSWWTLFILIPAVAGIASSGFHSWNVSLLFLGVFLLAVDQRWFGRNLWPFTLGAALILIGIWVITGGRHIHEYSGHSHAGSAADVKETVSGCESTEDCPDYSCTFSNVRYVNRSKNFSGGKASSAFGSMTVDLREIELAGTAVFEVSAAFGSLEILVPKGIPIKIDVTPVLGGLYTGASFSPPSGGQTYLEIRGSSTFGSVRIN